jgi:hypothetical protein
MLTMLRLSLIFTLSTLCVCTFCQDPGCTDSNAINYESSAVGDDGSCYYECDSPPVNDNCSEAIQLEIGVEVTGSLCCASAGVDDLCIPDDVTAFGVWYHANLGDCDTFILNLQNLSGQNIAMTIYEDANGDGCAGIEEIVCCPIEEDSCSGNVPAFVILSPESEYYFYVYTTDEVNCGEFSLTIDCGIYGCNDLWSCDYDPEATVGDATCTYDCSCAATNTTCFEALTIEPGFADTPTTYCLSNTYFPSEIIGCDLEYQVGMWYTFQGTGSAVELSTCGSDWPTRIDIFTTSTSDCSGVFSCALDALTLENVTFADNVCTEDDTELHLNTFVGETYFVYLSAPGNAYFDFTFTASQPGDFNEDGAVDTTDLLLLLGQIGCVQNCLYDINGDGVTNVLDILLFLTYF